MPSGSWHPLLDYITARRAAGETRLFEVRLDSKSGVAATISKGFTNYLHAIGITPRRSTETVGFHSFRKTTTQALQGCGLSDERWRAYLGHAPGEDDSHATRYMRPWTPLELADFLKGMTWGAVAGFRWLARIAPRARRVG